MTDRYKKLINFSKEGLIFYLEKNKAEKYYVIEARDRTVCCFGYEIWDAGQIITHGTFLIKFKPSLPKEEHLCLILPHGGNHYFNKTLAFAYQRSDTHTYRDNLEYNFSLDSPIKEVHFAGTVQNLFDTTSYKNLSFDVKTLCDDEYSEHMVEFQLSFRSDDFYLFVELSRYTYDLEYNQDYSSREYWEEYDDLYCYKRHISVAIDGVILRHLPPGYMNKFSVFDIILRSFEDNGIYVYSLPNGKADQFQKIESLESILEKKPHESFGPNSGKGTRIYSETVREDDFKENWTYVLHFDKDSKKNLARVFSETIMDIGFYGYERYNDMVICADRQITRDMVRDRNGERFNGHPARRNDRYY